MKWIFFFVLCIHSLIHSLGFLKAFGLADIKELKLPISQFWWVFWGVTAILLLIWGVLRLSDYKLSWTYGLLASIFSFIVIVKFSTDARFGLVLTIPLMGLAIMDLISYQFAQQIELEKIEVLSRTGSGLTFLESTELPEPVQTWYNRSVQESHFNNQVCIEQIFRLKLKPEQKDWLVGQANQQFNLSEPGFIWTIDIKANPFFSIKGRDKLDRGKGSMSIRLWSVFPVVNQSDTKKLNEGTLQRFLGELVWFPYFAKSSLINWEPIDSKRARATIHHHQTMASGVFTFHTDGRFDRFETLRYFGGEKDAKVYPWIIEASEWKRFHGMEIPTKCKATWILDAGPWTWAEIEIQDISYK